MAIIQIVFGFLGRALFSLVFIAAGFNTIFHWQEVEQELVRVLHDAIRYSNIFPYLQTAFDWGLGQSTWLLLGATICQILGGVMIFLGLGVRLGAFLLLIFLIPATLLFHPFWFLQEPDRQAQITHFLLNISLTGALFFLLAYGKGCAEGVKGTTEKTG